MNKNLISIVILFLCAFSLLIGLIGNFDKSANFKNLKSHSKINRQKNFSKNRIILLSLNGVIEPSADSGNFFCSASSAEELLKSLKELEKDNSVKGIIIKINSPGGTVALSQNIYDKIMELKKNIPIVVSMEDIAASGGYYIASAADRIVAQRGTLTGSVGVIMSSMDFHQLLEDKLSIKSNVIKSGKFKDLGSGLRQMSNEDKALLQGIINDSYHQFVADIIKSRVKRQDKYTAPKKELSAENLFKYADGRIFTGNQAYEYGFVDAIGNVEVAHKMISTMAKEKFKLAENELPLDEYTSFGGLFDLFFGTTESLLKKQTIGQYDFIPKSLKMSKQPLYLWE